MNTENTQPDNVNEDQDKAGLATSDLLVHGSKFKIVITLDAELVTDTDGVTTDQICDMMLYDDAYGLKSIVVGKINPNSKSDHDTEILWNNLTVAVA